MIPGMSSCPEASRFASEESFLANQIAVYRKSVPFVPKLVSLGEGKKFVKRGEGVGGFKLLV
jgi:hypothetical protein